MQSRILVVGQPMSGKSTFIHGLVLKCAEGGHSVAVFSTDDTLDDLLTWIRHHERVDTLIVEWQLSVRSSMVPEELKKNFENKLGVTFGTVFRIEKIR